MKILVLHTPKGGSGKSTLAREIAVAASLAGRSAALADLDPQGTTSGWYKRRKAEAPALVRYTPGASLDPLRAAGVDWLVVDTPPATPAFLPGLLALADAVLVPVRPTPDDLLAAAPIARSLAKHSAWAFVLSQVPPRSRLTDGAARQLAALGRVAPAQMTFRADFPAAAIAGQAAMEFTGKAAEEAAALYAYAVQLMGESDATSQG
ncbi:ParA family protein [Siccirubricoccus deserti]|uniref:ParA family protein n=1 Tax=Siccirubricoccus deserti TaxID=2013562 RepID=A0A9X0UG75_9PROT|nr:ParA family protein [Siccirubricoccus deserti]MBC4018716.1 ParA family protein [Siccirubricoccus deserti]